MNIENSVDEIAVSFDNRTSQISLKPVPATNAAAQDLSGTMRDCAFKIILKKVKKTLKNIAKIVDKRI